MEFDCGGAHRYRTYSKDSVDAYPSSSSSSFSAGGSRGYHYNNPHQTTTSNNHHQRHRSNSTHALMLEDSSLSSTDEKRGGSGSGEEGMPSGAPSLPSKTTETGKTRRRSHRPRGCRGGRKNRKKQLAKAGGVLGIGGNNSVPTEIGTICPLSPKENVDSASNTNHIAFLAPKVFWGNNNDQNSSSDLSSSVGGASISDEKNSHWRQPMSSMESSTNIMSTRSNYNSSTTTGGGGGVCGIYNPQNLYSSPYLFRPVQDPFSIGVSATASSTDNEKPQDILPPLPLPMEKDTLPPTSEGPNPYALTTSMTESLELKSGTSFAVVNSSSDTSTVYSSSAAPSTVTSNSSNGFVSAVLPLSIVSAPVPHVPVVSVSLPPPLPRTAEDYRNERIQKQRQMMADGSGSLFATSPRTFLMGGRPVITATTTNNTTNLTHTNMMGIAW